MSGYSEISGASPARSRWGVPAALVAGGLVLTGCGNAPRPNDYTNPEILKESGACVRNLEGQIKMEEIRLAIVQSDGAKAATKATIENLRLAAEIARAENIPCYDVKMGKELPRDLTPDYKYDAELANDPYCLQKVAEQRTLLGPATDYKSVEYFTDNPDIYNGVRPKYTINQGINSAQLIQELVNAARDCKQ